MNSTQWATLAEFVKHLGRTGKCKVDETPKGWFVTYIDRDSEAALKNERTRSDLADEEKQERAIAPQIERELLQNNTPPPPPPPPPYPNPNPDNSRIEKVVAFALQPVNADTEKPPLPKLELEEAGKIEKDAKRRKSTASSSTSALDELMAEEERSNRKGCWLCEGVVVKVTSRTSAEKKGYCKQKGVVLKVIDKYVGEIQMLESKHVRRVDQDEMETVIPQIGGAVRIVNGAYRGSNARLQVSVNADKFCAKIRIEKGIFDGRVMQVDYEDFCKCFQTT